MGPTKGVRSGGSACGPRPDATRNRSAGDPGRPLSGQRAGRFNHHISPTPAAPPQLRARTSSGGGGGCIPGLWRRRREVSGSGLWRRELSGSGHQRRPQRLRTPAVGARRLRTPDPGVGGGGGGGGGAAATRSPPPDPEGGLSGHGFRRRQLGGSRLGRAGHSPYIPCTKTAVAGLLPQSYAQLSSVRGPRRRPSRV